jgi:hypothetical protein
MLQRLRRVVTGHDSEGKSVVAIDGPPGATIGTDAAGLGEIWITDGTPADNTASGDAARRPVRLEPPAGGSVFRYFVLAPEDKTLSAAEMEAQAAAGIKAIGGEHCRVDTSRHPGMHKTRTVDYVLLLEGDVTLILEKGEVRLKQYDVVVQRGTNHAWRNNGDQPALLAAVLIDAKPL